MENDDYRTVRVYTKKSTLVKTKMVMLLKRNQNKNRLALKKKTLLKIMILFVFFQVKNMKN